MAIVFEVENGCCCPDGQKCSFCAPGTDLPPSFTATVAGCTVINTTHDYTPLNGSAVLVQGVISFSGAPCASDSIAAACPDTVTGFTPDSSSPDWYYYEEYDDGPYLDGFFWKCDRVYTLWHVGCTGAPGVYVFDKSIARVSYAQPGPTCAVPGLGKSFVTRHGFTTTGNVLPTNTGNAISTAISGSFPGFAPEVPVPVLSGDTCDPVALSSSPAMQMVLGQDPPYNANIFTTGWADNTTAVTVTLSP